MDKLLKLISIFKNYIFRIKNEKTLKRTIDNIKNDAVDNSTYNILLFDNKFIYYCLGNELKP